MSPYRNLEIIGVSKEAGGRFARVLIVGSGKILGDVECDSFELPGAGKVENGGLIVHGPMEVSGAGSVEGAVRAASLDVNGSLKTEQSCEISGDLDVNGSLKTEGPCCVGGAADICGSWKTQGNLTVGKLEVTGSLDVEGRLQASEAEIDGILKVDGEVQAEVFRAGGAVLINGLLNAETVELEVSGEDRIGSIGGGSVTVRRGAHHILGIFRKRPHLSAELIEADEIDLEYTDCRTVRGVNVRIGPECVIDRVEYSGSLTTDANCTVREKIKV